MSFAFDKYKLSRALEKEGFYEHEKADVFAEIFSEMFSQTLVAMLGSSIASKQDVQVLGENIRGVKEDLRVLELRLTAEIEKSRAESDAKHAATQLQIAQMRSELTEKIEQSRAESDAKHAATQLQIAQMRSELTEKIERTRAELTEKIERSRAELTEKIEQSRAELTEKIERSRSELTEKIEQSRAESDAKHADVLKWCIISTCTIIGTMGVMFTVAGVLGKLVFH